MAKKIWTPAARKAFALKMARARAAKGGRRKRRKNPRGSWKVDGIVSFRGGAGHPIVQVLTANSKASAIAAYRAWLDKEGYTVQKITEVERLAGKYGDRVRRKNPTKAQVKEAAKKIAKRAASLAWAGTKKTARFTGRVAGAGAKAAAAEVKASICRPRAKNPKSKGFEVRLGSKRKRKLVWTAMTRADAIHVARVYAKAYPRKVVSVHAEK
jgi:hypothetical protein